MKTAKYTLMFLACAAAIPAFAQNTMGSNCGTTNFDRDGNRFTVVSPSGTANQQCFITVVPKQSWTGGAPDLASSQLVEGNYEVALSGGGGGGGGGAGHDNKRATGQNGDGAVPLGTVRYLKPGVYRLTIGSGGQGGAPGASNGQSGADGAPTSLSDANSGETVAGFPRAEYWNGGYPQNAQARSGERGGGGAGGNGDNSAGSQGNNGFIRIAFKDPVPSRVQAEPATSSMSQAVTTPPPADIRPARRDRN